MGWGARSADPPSSALVPTAPPHWPLARPPTPRYLKFSSQREQHDPMMSGCLPSNPWVTDDDTYWTINAPR